VAERARPVALAREQVLPVLGPLEPLLPGGLRRGSTVAVASAHTSLALAVLAGPSAAGSWAAVVGVPSLGLAAAAGYGVALERLVVVAPPPAQAWGTVVATLADAFDVVLVRCARPPRSADVRRLTARARERGSVLVVLGEWEGADVRLSIAAADWVGLGEGDGHLRGRRVVVAATGRRGAARPRQATLWLPSVSGAVESVVAPPVPFRVCEPDVAPRASFGSQSA
jgi:hypothetical protein